MKFLLEVSQRTSKIKEQASSITTELFKEVRTVRECTMEPEEAHRFEVHFELLSIEIQNFIFLCTGTTTTNRPFAAPRAKPAEHD